MRWLIRWRLCKMSCQLASQRVGNFRVKFRLCCEKAWEKAASDGESTF